MNGRISDDTLQAIRERVSIVEVVSGHVALKRTGRNYSGLCPFHDEKSPSFTVSEERGLFHCFGCGKGGTVFTFVMQADHITFPEAVEVLARRAGVELPRNPRNDEVERKRNALVEVSGIAQRYFAGALKSAQGASARVYLNRRGLSEDTIERFGIGFAPTTSGLMRALGSSKSAVACACEVGLLGRRSDGSYYERFRARVMFPIRDSGGRVIGFGGRTLGSEQPKYLNSPESPLFHKGNVLYGLFEAKDSIRDAERIVLVEGYVDAIAMAQAGIPNVVATLGTALGASQLRLARRFAPEVIAFFDGDRAGRDAAARAFATCVEADVWGLGAFLPEGFDPDTYIQKHGVDATRALLDSAVPLAEFFLDRNVPGVGATVPQRARAASAVATVLANVKDAAQFELLARSAAQRLGVDESLFRDMRQTKERVPVKDFNRAATAAALPLPEPDTRPEEAALVEAAILDKGAALLIRDSGVLSLMDDRMLAGVVGDAIQHWAGDGDPSSVLSSLPAGLCARVSAALLGRGAIAASDRIAVARDCIERVRNRTLRSKATALRAELQRAEIGDDSYHDKLLRMNEVIRRRQSSSD